MTTNVGKTCPYCQYPIKPAASVRVCPACGIVHHAECWQHNAGCTTFGCTGRSTASNPSPARSAMPQVLDLSDIMSEPESPASQRTGARDVGRAGEPPLTSAAREVGACGSIIGCVIGFGLGAAADSFFMAVLGALVGLLFGWLLLYLLILGVFTWMGAVLGAAIGSDASLVGALIGLTGGAVLIAVGRCKMSR